MKSWSPSNSSTLPNVKNTWSNPGSLLENAGGPRNYCKNITQCSKLRIVSKTASPKARLFWIGEDFLTNLSWVTLAALKHIIKGDDTNKKSFCIKIVTETLIIDVSWCFTSIVLKCDQKLAQNEKHCQFCRHHYVANFRKIEYPYSTLSSFFTIHVIW